MDSHLQVWRRFWFAHPALALAFGACLGCAIALGATSSLWIAPFLLLAGIPRWKLLTVAAALLYLWTSHLILLPPQSKIQGTATFSIDSIHQRERHGKLSWELRGTLHSFSEGQTPVASNLPFALALPRQQVLPSLQYRYRAPAGLDWKGMGAASLKIDRTVKWERDRLQPSLAWVRWLSQERLRDYLSSKLPHKGARELLIGLATGSFEDRHLLMDYRRCGLSHILAVSGFHFSLLAL
ncbi:MAG: hypothetical protein KDK78_00095, partial [Chlamydiia bacterium]|nr:hypothetical protein [Chlamydiia bacterium]